MVGRQRIKISSGPDLDGTVYKFCSSPVSWNLRQLMPYIIGPLATTRISAAGTQRVQGYVWTQNPCSRGGVPVCTTNSSPAHHTFPDAEFRIGSQRSKCSKCVTVTLPRLMSVARLIESRKDCPGSYKSCWRDDR